jgi:hypothetical protein
MTPDRQTTHERPDGVDDATVDAVGTVSEAYEYLIRARGHLYSFHQLLGRVDLLLGEAADGLEEAGHTDLAEALRRDVVGRNALDGRWTFQIVEEFDATYFDVVTAAERDVRDRLVAGRRHVFEAEMKDGRRSAGRPGHERRPAQAYTAAVETD